MSLLKVTCTRRSLRTATREMPACGETSGPQSLPYSRFSEARWNMTTISALFMSEAESTLEEDRHFRTVDAIGRTRGTGTSLFVAISITLNPSGTRRGFHVREVPCPGRHVDETLIIGMNERFIVDFDKHLHDLRP